MPIVNDPFHRALKHKLDDMIDSAVDDLSNGSATQGQMEAATTAEKYAAKIGWIRGLRAVLAVCDEVADEIIRPARVDVEER